MNAGAGMLSGAGTKGISSAKQKFNLESA